MKRETKKVKNAFYPEKKLVRERYQRGQLFRSSFTPWTGSPSRKRFLQKRFGNE